jgi:molecular chaperone DnaK
MHNADDQKKKEEVEIRNTAEQLIYTSEKALKDNKEKIPEDVSKSIEEKIATLKTAKSGTDINAVKSATEALSTELQKIGEIMSKAAQANQAQPNAEAKPADDKGGEGNVRDAEYKEGYKK